MVVALLLCWWFGDRSGWIWIWCLVGVVCLSWFMLVNSVVFVAIFGLGVLVRLFSLVLRLYLDG